MHISWLGQTCVKLQTKNLDQEATILINAYKPSLSGRQAQKGNFPRSFSPDIAIFSSGNKNAATLSQNPFIIDSLGEFELKNIVIYSLPNLRENNIFKINAESMSIVHLGRLNKNLTNGELEQIMNPDILFVPTGGEPDYLDSKTAANLVTTLEPRIVIPMGYKCDLEPHAQPVSKFISEIGLKPENETKKIIIKKKDLPAEETRLIILDKE